MKRKDLKSRRKEELECSSSEQAFGFKAFKLSTLKTLPEIYIFLNWLRQFKIFTSFRQLESKVVTIFALGSGCSTAVEHKPHNREVVGLFHAGCCAFFSSLSSQSQ